MTAGSQRTHGALQALLDAVNSRLRLRAFILAALAAAVAGLAVLFAGSIVAALGGGRPAVPLFALIAAAAAAIAVLVLQGGRRQGVMRLAAEIDRRAGLAQSYLTAIDLDQARGDVGPVGRVLMARVADRAESVDPAKVVSLHDRPVRLAAGAAAVLALAFGVAEVRLHRAVAPAGDIAGRTDQSADEEALAAVRAAAERMAADAEATDNDYLAAVARALSERVAQTDAATGGEAVSQELQDLLEHAARAYGDNLPGWLDAGSEQLLAELAQNMEAFDAAEALAALREAERQERGDPASMYEREEGIDDRFAGRTDEQVISGSGAEPGQGAEGEGGEPPAGGADPGVRPMSPQELQFAGRIPVGAALQSGKGVSDQAGLGSQTMEEDADWADIASAPGEDVLVTTRPVDGGNRIRIEIAPTADDGALATEGPLATGGGPVGALGEGIDRRFVPPDRLALVARYLNRTGQ